MIVTKKALPRRTLLKGIGTALALPWLESMVPALTAHPARATGTARRLGIVFIPMGAHIEQWTPKEDGRITELSPSLTSLQPLMDQLTIITNLEIKNAYSPGNHATSNSGFLSCAKAKMTEGSDYELATTVDQIAARRIGGDTALPSLELAMDMLSVVGNCDNGFACVYMNNMSWSSPTTPLPAEANPRVVFERLFGDGSSPEERRIMLRRRGSILDWIREDMSRLRLKLGPADRTRVNEYVEAIREVERRIQLAENHGAATLEPDIERPLGAPPSWEEHVKLMFDLQVLAFQADITRVITFQLAREASTRTYPQIGVSGPHHAITHHSGNLEKLAMMDKVNAYHVSLFADFLRKLKATPDGEGSLLDNSLLVYGSGMGNPDVHDHVNVPMLVARGRSSPQPGALHIRYVEPVPMANLWLTLLNRLDVNMDRFADSNGRIEELA